MYGCESWPVKSEHQKIDAFELWHRVGHDRSDLAAAAAAEPISPNLCVQQQGYGEGTVKYFEYFQYCCSDGLLTLVKCKSCFHV